MFFLFLLFLFLTLLSTTYTATITISRRQPPITYRASPAAHHHRASPVVARSSNTNSGGGVRNSNCGTVVWPCHNQTTHHHPKYTISLQRQRQRWARGHCAPEPVFCTTVITVFYTVVETNKDLHNNYELSVES